MSAFEQAELARDDAERKRLLTFVIIGGGPTGVEMAGAIAEVARQTLARDFRGIDPRTARIVLIEAGPRLLPTFSEKHSSYARDTLAAMGVDVMTSSPVRQCDERGVDLAVVVLKQPQLSGQQALWPHQRLSGFWPSMIAPVG